MATEGHLAVAAVGLLAGALGIWMSAYGKGGTGPALLYFAGFTVFGVSAIDAMESAELGQRARSLWVIGTFGLVAGLLVLGARRSPAASRTRTTAAVIACMCVVLFLLELVFRIDPFAGLFDFRPGAVVRVR